MMTPQEEKILKEITEFQGEPWAGKKVFSPEKLAAYLVKYAPPKSEEVTMTITRVDPTPPSEEVRADATYKGVTAKVVIDWEKRAYNLDIGDTPSEEKKCCDGCSFVGWNEKNDFCKEVECPCHSPTPPDDWEEDIRLVQVPSKTTKSGWEVLYDPIHLINWLRTKKKEWEEHNTIHGYEQGRTNTLTQLKEKIEGFLSETAHRDPRGCVRCAYQRVLSAIENDI